MEVSILCIAFVDFYLQCLDLPRLEEAKESLSDEVDEEDDENEEDEGGKEGEEDPDATKVANSQEEDEYDPDATKVAGSQESISDNFDGGSDSSVAVTEYTERALKTIDSKSAIVTLPDLYENAQKIIEKSMKKDIREKDRNRNLKALKHLFGMLEEYKAPYGVEQFIDVKMVMKKLLDSTASMDRGSKGLVSSAIPITAILQSANLAILMREIDQLKQDIPQDVQIFFQALDKDFPHRFVSKFITSWDLNPEHSKLISETIDLVLDIRTHLFRTVSHNSQRDANFDPDHYLAEYFLKGNDLRGVEFDFSGLETQSKEDGEMLTGSDALAQRINARIDVIRSTFKPAENATEEGQYIDFNRLDELFPRSKFLDSLIDYSQKRLTEVDVSIETRGGIEGVMKPLEEIVKDIESDVESENESNVEPEIPVHYEQPKEVTSREK